MDVVKRLRADVADGTVIHTTSHGIGYSTKRWARRRDEVALVYLIPSRIPCRPANEKGVTESEIRLAYRELAATGEFCKSWFIEALPRCNKHGGCNFHALGGLFVKLGEASRSGSCYVARKVG